MHALGAQASSLLWGGRWSSPNKVPGTLEEQSLQGSSETPGRALQRLQGSPETSGKALQRLQRSPETLGRALQRLRRAHPKQKTTRAIGPGR